MKQRKQKPKKWIPLRNVTAELGDDYLNNLERLEGRELLGVWLSPLYDVNVFRVPCPEWPGGELTWLSIKRSDGKGAVRDWRHLQRIKSEICGPEREAVELFPAESRHVDTSNQYHLWVLAEGQRFPFGYPDRAIVKAEEHEDRYVRGKARQRAFEPGLEPEGAMTMAEADELLQRKP